jgi:hypothetical protein
MSRVYRGVLFLIVAIVAAQCGVAMAQSIGIDWFGGNGTGDQTQMLATDVAGVVPHGNWNSFLDATGTTAETFPLNLSTGAASGASVTFSGSPNDWDQNINQATSANHKMMLGYIDTNDTSITTVVVSGLPASFTGPGYNVILYYDGDNGANQRVGRYEINGVSMWGRDAGVNFGGTFTQGQTTTNPAPGMSGTQLDNLGAVATTVPAGNYMTFSNLTAATFTLNVQAHVASDATNRAALNGMQIVAVPEPATIALVAIGLLGSAGFLVRRRRQGVA